MKSAIAAFVIVMLLGMPLWGQQEIAAGTVLPLRLETTLKPGRVHAGDQIRAEVMQDIPGTQVRRGARMTGHVLSTTAKSITLRIDTIAGKHSHILIRTSLRAIASMMEVSLAEDPESGPDRGLPPADWTTQQVGGEQVYRGGGPVASGMETVGEPTPYGALGRTRANPPCRGAVAGNDKPQALWVFSTNACGTYGFPGVTIEQSGRSSPQGIIVLDFGSGNVVIRSGSGLLLRVLPS